MTTPDNSRTLRECPFCGGEATVRINPDRSNQAKFPRSSAGCASCNVFTAYFSMTPFTKGGIDVWNTRATTFAEAKYLPVLEKMVEAITNLEIYGSVSTQDLQAAVELAAPLIGRGK